MSVVLNKEQLNIIHQKSVEMLEVFKAFCDENNLLFYFCGGCCIGAVREGGFLAWDDDADVFMPREDYEKLFTLWKDTPRYALLRTTKDRFVGITNATLVDKSSTLVSAQQAGLNIPHGIKLDIFPLDGCKTGIKRKMQKIHGLLFCLYVSRVVPKNHGKLVELAGRFLLKIRSEKGKTKAWQKAEKKMSSLSIKDASHITELTAGPRYAGIEYPKEIFASAKTVPFENTKMPVPVGYDTYLKMAFGDYMTPPSPDARMPEHEVYFVDLDLPCDNYKGDLK